MAEIAEANSYSDTILNGGSEDDSPSYPKISTDPNAPPRDGTISQSASGIPDDSSALAQITPEEEVRVTDRIHAL